MGSAARRAASCDGDARGTRRGEGAALDAGASSAAVAEQLSPVTRPLVADGLVACLRHRLERGADCFADASEVSRPRSQSAMQLESSHCVCHFSFDRDVDLWICPTPQNFVLQYEPQSRHAPSWPQTPLR